jgi:hypothetical protein
MIAVWPSPLAPLSALNREQDAAVPGRLEEGHPTARAIFSARCHIALLKRFKDGTALRQSGGLDKQKMQIFF